MLPTRSQFRKWTYPTKFGFVSFFVGLLISTAFWIFPDAGKQLVARPVATDASQMLTGTWKGVSNHGELNGDPGMVVSGYMQLLSSGKYNFSGEIEVHSNGSALQFTALAAGTWKPTDTGFVLTASDIKTVPQKIKRPGIPDEDLNQLRSNLPAYALPRLEDFMPHGASQEYEVLELSSTRLRTKSRDIRGNVVTYAATRQ